LRSATLALTIGAAGASRPDEESASGRDLERELVRACQRGDREAYDRLVERYQRAVYRLCYRYVNDHEDANDLAQDAFIRAWRAVGRFRGDSAFSTWLYRIAVNACLNHRARRRPASEEISDRIADPRQGADRGVQEGDEARVVREAVSRLPEKQRATLILKVYQELTHEEVARILGASVGTVKSNLFHALANLRRSLAGPGMREEKSP